MDNKEEITLLSIKSSRISSLKSLFFPMIYEVKKFDRQIFIIETTRNWIGQKTTHKQYCSHFRIKGVVLRKINFGSKYAYGRFWFTDCKKIKDLLHTHIPSSSRIEWSDKWF